MQIRFFDSLSNAYARMKTALFYPFNLHKWMVVGFTAFLAGLIDWSGNGGSYGGRDGGAFSRHNLEDVVDFPNIAWQWLMDHPGWFSLILVGIFLLILFLIFLTWLSSRGKFMFLDNVVHDRAEIAKPWHEFRALGHSLFFWRLGYGLVSLVIVIRLLMTGFKYFVDLYQLDFPEPEVIFAIIKMVLMLLTFVVFTGYVTLFLNAFVVPIMYKNNKNVWWSWSKFLKLFQNHFLHFIGYGLFIFVLTILVVIGVVAGGLLTCCLGFLLVIIPYIGSVVLLPISYTYRALSIEFLEQFGPEYALFPRMENSTMESKTQ